MFVVKFSVNLEEIGELYIQRTKTSKSGLHTYRVVKPEGYSDIEVKHKYDDGYFDLVLKVMKELKKHGYSTQPKLTWEETTKDLKNYVCTNF